MYGNEQESETCLTCLAQSTPHCNFDQGYSTIEGVIRQTTKQPIEKPKHMKPTKEILNKARELAKSHIKLVTETGFDDKWESDPYDHWDHVDGFDVNFVGVPVLDEDGDDTKEYTWSFAVYSGQYDSKGYWSTNYSDSFPFEL
ncbi:MAG: hypothetical protein EBY39_11955 [Flavobacteriia bacterium]|nr:hypothetical protein [Flavobacteriia bacterium]